MAADIGALRESPSAQALGLALLSVLLSVLLVLVPAREPYLPGPMYGVALFLACGAMLAAFLRVTTYRVSSRLWAILIGVAAYLLIGLLYGLLRFAITQERSFLITMSTYMWPWLLMWDAGCIVGVWHCVTLGN